jgi:hypothetical protein
MNPEEAHRRVGNLEAQVQTLSRQVTALQAQPRGVAVQSQSGVTILGDLPMKLKTIFNLGFQWIGNKINVRAATNGGITVDATGVAVKVKTNSGLTLDANGLAVLLEANKGLSMGAAGLATLLKANGGLLSGAAGLYLDLLLGVVTALTPAASVEMDFDLGCAFTLTPGEAEVIDATGGQPGQTAYLLITTSGIISYNLTFGTNFVTQGVLATGIVSGVRFLLSFYTLDGTTWIESSRTGAMT